MSLKWKIFIIVFLILTIKLLFTKTSFKPAVDVTPITELPIPTKVESILDMQFDSTYVRGKSGEESNKNTDQSPIKEEIQLNYLKNDIYISIFYNDKLASDYYEDEKQIIKYPAYINQDDKQNRYYLTYAKRAHADQFGCFRSMDYYTCYAVFLRNNLVIKFYSRLSGEKDNSLNEAIRYVGTVMGKRFE